MTSKIDPADGLADILTGTAQVQVTIVATVTVPTDRHGSYLKGDAVNGALLAVSQGEASVDVYPFTPSAHMTPGLSPDEVTSWTPGKRI